jgi:Rrf2 family protein
MKLSVKGRYALAAAVSIAERSAHGENVSVNSIADKLGISKIYLEQVFGQLKKAELLVSVKGPKGGYRLSRGTSDITAWDVLSAIEQSLTERTEETVADEAPEIEFIMRAEIYNPLDTAIRDMLSGITVSELLDKVKTQAEHSAFMLNM